MRDTYSIYEAEARLSALVRQVREGRRVIITVHGKPVAELRAVEAEGSQLADRLHRLEERGVLVRGDSTTPLDRIARRPGALQRFLKERE